jgi:N6-adenosine-specific RNA methylase IME4
LVPQMPTSSCCSAPGAVLRQFPSVVEVEAGQHSEKPALFAERIQQTFPNAARLEMFARAQRLGWGCWGNEF